MKCEVMSKLEECYSALVLIETSLDLQFLFKKYRRKHWKLVFSLSRDFIKGQAPVK